MQLAIDINAETPAALRLAANFLLDHALMREEAERGVAAPPPPTPPDLAAHIVPPPPAPPPPVDNVVNFPPPAPPAPLDATAPASASSAAPAAANVPPPPVTLPAASVSDVFDDSGVPWDGRIHQKGKNKKKDGTWKLQKGIDPNLVEAVMRELTPRIRSTASSAAHTPETVGASPAPVTLPGAPANAGANGAPAYPPGAVPPPPPPPPPPANLAPPVPVPPPPPVQGGEAQAQAPITTPGAEGPGVDPFRALVTKITKARAAGKISPDEVTQALAAAGAPNLQLLNSMAHLIPSVDASIDALLAMR